MTSRLNRQNPGTADQYSLSVTLPTSDEADRMKDTIRTPHGRWNGWVILGLLVSLAGCASPLTNNQWLAPSAPALGEGASNPSVSPLTGATLMPPSDPGEVDFSAGDIAMGTSAVNHPLATTPNMATGATETGMAPYVARQFPSDPPSTYIAPPTVSPPSAAAAPGTVTGNAPPPNYLPPPTSSGVGTGVSNPPVYRPADGAPMLGNTGLAEPYAPITPNMGYQPGPTVREADLIINGFPARTGRIMLGGAVNSDAGITGQLTIDERNFDICRWPRSFQDMFSGTAFRGAGQTFRLEAAPGTRFKRYTLQFADPNLFGYKPVSMSVSGFLYDRRFNDWDEERLGGRLALGYRITPDLSISAGITGQRVDMSGYSDPSPVAKLNEVRGKTSLFSGEFSLVHDTRDSPIQASRGHFFEANFEQAFGDFEYSRFELEYRRYWLLAERADGSGKQTLSFSTQTGYSGDETPIYENFFAGGYATIRGFQFRGASPVESGIEVGGRFQWLNTVEYMFPITADDAFRGVGFVDFGTVEPTSQLSSQSYRVAPGLGLRVALPMLGPAPLAFDFAYPVAKADTDQVQIFSFYMSMVR